MNPHNLMSALDPPGTSPRRWRCRYCHQEANSFDELEAKECTYQYPVCTYCGQTPTCALDCKGIALAFAQPEVVVVGMSVTPPADETLH